MKFLIDGFQAIMVDMGIDLSRADISMTEHLLEGAQVGPAREQMGSEAVSEGMDGHFSR